MARIQKPPTRLDGGVSHGQADQNSSAQRSKMRETRAEQTPTRAADKAKLTTKDKLKADMRTDIARPYRDTGAL